MSKRKTRFGVVVIAGQTIIESSEIGEGRWLYFRNNARK